APFPTDNPGDPTSSGSPDHSDGSVCTVNASFQAPWLRERRPCSRATGLVSQTNSRPIVADRLDRALLECGAARRLLGRRGGLTGHVAAPGGIVAEEVGRGRLAAEVAVDARVIDVESPRNVLGDLA